MQRSKYGSFRASRSSAMMMLMLLLFMRLPVDELDKARAARGFIYLTGQYTLNTQVLVHAATAAWAWGGSIAILILYLGRSRFRWADWAFVAGLVATIAAAYTNQLGEDVPTIGSGLLSVLASVLTPAACLCWIRRARLRLRNPITMASA